MKRRWRTRRFSPLAVNLAAGTIARLLLPYTLATGGERYRYFEMSQFFPPPGCQSFHCFRILPPLLTALWPLGVADAFLATGLLFQVLAGTVLWLVAEKLHGSRRVALITTGWFWVTWGSILTLTDPFLITDPVQAFWSIAVLYLLLDRRYLAALLFLILGTAVKETVLIVPMIYAVYLVLAGERRRQSPVWPVALVAVPLVIWVLLRIYLTRYFGFGQLNQDIAYIRLPHFFAEWLPSLAPWPKNLGIAALYLFGACGAAWLLCPFGLALAGRRQRALTAASVLPMLFLPLYQLPERALATFPYAILIPAAIFAARLPLALNVALLLANAAFTVRMNAAVSWLPKTPILLAVLLALMIVSVIVGYLRPATPLQLAEDLPQPGPAVSWRSLWSRAGTKPAVVIGAVFVLGCLFGWRAVGSSQPLRLSLAVDGVPIVDDEGGTPGLAISPDGTRLVFVGQDRVGVRHLWVRALDSDTSAELPDTAGASAPFWSPDGTRVGFFDASSLKTLDLATGRVRVVAAAPSSRGGAWGTNGVIVFAAASTGGLSQVPVEGGTVTTATEVDRSRLDLSERWPSFLPDGDHFLFVTWSANAGERGLYVGSMRTRAAVHLSATDITSAVYVPPAFVFVSRGGQLWVESFDTRRLKLLGEPLPVAHSVAESIGFNRAAIAASRDRLVFAAATSRSRISESAGAQVNVFDRTGRHVGALGSVDLLGGIELAPDQERVIVGQRYTLEVTMWNVGRKQIVKLAANLWPHAAPIWSPDSRRMVFNFRPEGTDRWELREADPSGVGPERVLLTGLPFLSQPTSWSPDGRVVLYHAHGQDKWSVWAESIQGGAPVELVAGLFHKMQGQFSPDGRWVAFVSDESGRNEVYVQAYPATGAKWRVSTDGGAQPRWRGDSKELVYLASDRILMAVPIDTTPSFHAGLPERLFETRILPESQHLHRFEYAMTADGQRFLINTLADPEPSAPVHVVLDWRDAVKHVRTAEW